MGKVIGVIGKRTSLFIGLGLGLLANIYVQILYYKDGKYGYEWYLAFIFYAFTLGESIIIQYLIIATDFELREVAFGAGSFIVACASGVILQLYAYFYYLK